jgi:hypothetical protein
MDIPWSDCLHGDYSLDIIACLPKLNWWGCEAEAETGGWRGARHLAMSTPRFLLSVSGRSRLDRRQNDLR